MRIIDKNTDFYDYLQNVYPDDTFTLDRSGESYMLTKEMICGHLWLRPRGGPAKLYTNKPVYELGSLQVGGTIWLLLFSLIGKQCSGTHPADYTVELITSWKNYNKPRKLIQLKLIDFGYVTHFFDTEPCGYYFNDFDKDIIMAKVDALVDEVNTDNCRFHDITSHQIQISGKYVTKHFPILKASGISNCIDPLDIYNAFDEYFSLEKQAAERTDAEGTTNNDKIINHGFDTKVSFRGKA